MINIVSLSMYHSSFYESLTVLHLQVVHHLSMGIAVDVKMIVSVFKIIQKIVEVIQDSVFVNQDGLDMTAQ